MGGGGDGDRWRRSLEPHANWLAGGGAELSGSVRSVPACQGEALIIRFAHPCGRAGAAGSEGPELRLSPIRGGETKVNKGDTQERERQSGDEEREEQRAEEEQL